MVLDLDRHHRPPRRWLCLRTDALRVILMHNAANQIVPRFIRDGIYNLIARTRYRIFGRFESCPIPKPETRAKFLDFARPGGGH